MLLLDSAQLEQRRGVVRAQLAPLYESLRAELDPVMERAPDLPRAKALLSRAGGRCERDGTQLDFDPWSPDRHRCHTCGTMHTGELHHRAWVTSFQLWLAERCLHAAMFHALGGEQRHGTFARDLLRRYARSYLDYPNRDNVLGPTRLFFSTYLESIWLLQICLAASFLAQTGDAQTVDVVRERIVEPSSALIGEYDEGMSNRQVWNNAALLAAALLVGDRAAADRIFHASSGVVAHLERALLPDGTWYEGENYHQFALRGLWYAVTLGEHSGLRLPDDLRRRFDSAFVAPYLTALPDFTMPSRKDSQYAVSLRQWRIAEITELGFARSQDPRLAAALARCYEDGYERRDTGRARSTADVERNAPASALTRADLGWRALLFARPVLPAAIPAVARSALLEQQGIAVFRRAPDVYAALDFGESGGGHGHPDRLNLLVSLGATRVLDDLGTGSYVERSLHWYRSTLAHNAPLVAGRSQPLHDGVLRAYDEREALGWVVAEFETDGVTFERTVVVTPDYLIDELEWRADAATRMELPWHLDADANASMTGAVLDGGTGLEDGFDFVRDVAASPLPAGTAVTLTLRENPMVRVHLVADVDTRVFRACAPGQPPNADRRFYVLRADASRGRFRALLSWSRDVVAELTHDGIVVALMHERHVHRRDDSGWHVELLAGAARSSIDLSGFRERRDAQPSADLAAPPPPIVLNRVPALPMWFTDLTSDERQQLCLRSMGRDEYRRSDVSWPAAGSPRAELAVGADADGVRVLLDVHAGDRRFVSADTINPYDNEHPDTMSAGVQLYTRTPDGSGGWTLIPEPDGRVRVRPIPEWGNLSAPSARWRASGDGYEMSIDLGVATASEAPVDLDVIVNETTADRERRRGQLVLSGAAGQFAYLRGDRHDVSALIPFVVVG